MSNAPAPIAVNPCKRVMSTRSGTRVNSSSDHGRIHPRSVPPRKTFEPTTNHARIHSAYCSAWADASAIKRRGIFARRSCSRKLALGGSRKSQMPRMRVVRKRSRRMASVARDCFDGGTWARSSDSWISRMAGASMLEQSAERIAAGETRTFLRSVVSRRPPGRIARKAGPSPLGTWIKAGPMPGSCRSKSEYGVSAGWASKPIERAADSSQRARSLGIGDWGLAILGPMVRRERTSPNREGGQWHESGSELAIVKT